MGAMAGVTSYTRALSDEQAVALKQVLEEEGFEFHDKEYVLYAARRDKVNVAVYRKGPKVLVQGKDTEDFVTFLLEPRVLGVAELGYEEVLNPEMFEPHVGIDESGKGDFFGPLVIAGVYVEAESAKALFDMGVADSKKIADPKILRLAGEIRKVPGLASEVITIGPERYNEMYAKIGNLNKLLAWGHARVLENLLLRVPDCPRAISDQFANARVLQSALMEKGREIQLVQKTKAESDLAVAAASILARESFLNWLEQAGTRHGIELPKGVSARVKEVAKALVEEGGNSILRKLVKTHFKTMGEVCE